MSEGSRLLPFPWEPESGEWYLSFPEFVTINGGGRMVAFLFCISRGSFSPAVRRQMRYGQLVHHSVWTLHASDHSCIRLLRVLLYEGLSYVNVVGRLHLECSTLFSFWSEHQPGRAFY